jgi:hypothetical protein
MLLIAGIHGDIPDDFSLFNADDIDGAQVAARMADSSRYV